MADFYLQTRLNMIDTMQNILKPLRQILGLGVQDFGDIIGLTRQSINNLETKKSKMSATQYVAICALIDNMTKDKPELASTVSSLFASVGGIGDFESSHNGSFLKKWFLCFPDHSSVVGLSANRDIDDTSLSGIADRYKVFIDDTALVHISAEELLAPFAAAMKEACNRFIVPLVVIESLQAQLLSFESDEAAASKRALNLLARFQREGLIDIRGEKSDVNICNTLISVFARFKAFNRIALVTQNNLLAQSISQLNNDHLGGFHILPLCYEDASIVPWTPEIITSGFTPPSSSWDTLE